MPFEIRHLIAVSVALNPINQPYSVIGYWEDITHYEGKTHEEIRSLLLAKYRDKYPDAERIDIRFPSL